MMFFAGVAGASAMILPGVSGGYLLLVLGVYVPVLSGDGRAQGSAQGQRLWRAASEPVLAVVLAGRYRCRESASWW